MSRWWDGWGNSTQGRERDLGMRIFPFPRMQSMGIVLTCLWPPFHNMNECPLILLSTNPIQWKIHAPIIRSFTSWKTVQPLVKKPGYNLIPMQCSLSPALLTPSTFFHNIVFFLPWSSSQIVHFQTYPYPSPAFFPSPAPIQLIVECQEKRKHITRSVRM